MHALILTTLAAATTAMPSYIAVPADQITFVDLRALRRVPRQTLAPPPLPNLYRQEYPPLPPLPQEYQPIPLQNYQQDPLLAINPPPQPEAPRLVRLPQLQESAPQASVPQLDERPPDFGEFVDFGAHTGDNGAFGWYADYPINNHEDHSGYRK